MTRWLTLKSSLWDIHCPNQSINMTMLPTGFTISQNTLLPKIHCKFPTVQCTVCRGCVCSYHQHCYPTTGGGGGGRMRGATLPPPAYRHMSTRTPERRNGGWWRRGRGAL